MHSSFAVCVDCGDGPCARESGRESGKETCRSEHPACGEDPNTQAAPHPVETPAKEVLQGAKMEACGGAGLAPHLGRLQPQGGRET